ncbi:MAG: hypothetical protein HOK67_24760 [Deltaproteobacteria bacterium]|nr:hypothetical protein [Deltaproteobacteria bacterium]
MAQNRFGSVDESGSNAEWHSLNFFCGEQRVFSYRFNQTPNIDINPKQFGKRTGSR